MDQVLLRFYDDNNKMISASYIDNPAQWLELLVIAKRYEIPFHTPQDDDEEWATYIIDDFQVKIPNKADNIMGAIDVFQKHDNF